MTAHYMPLYTGDLIRDTVDLSPSEFGIYMRLMMAYWNTGPIPDDPGKYGRITGTKPSLVKPILCRFFEPSTSTRLWHHKRLDRELSKCSHVSEKRREAAQKRHANARADAPPHAEANAVHMHAIRARATIPEPESKKEPPHPSGDGPPRNRGCRLFADWTPGEEGLAYAESQGISPIETLENFRDYWCAKSGKDATKLDWPATWRRWCRTDAEKKREAASRKPAFRGNGFAQLQIDAQAEFDNKIVPIRERLQ